MDPPSIVMLIRFGDFELNTATQELRERGVLRALSPQPFRLLVFLTENADRVVGRSEIHRCLWGERKYIDAARGINFCINQIRGALHDSARTSRFIKTQPRQGYRFAAAVERIVVEQTPPPVVPASDPPPLPIVEVGAIPAPPPPVTLSTGAFSTPRPPWKRRLFGSGSRMTGSLSLRQSPPPPIAVLLTCLLFLMIPTSGGLVAPRPATLPPGTNAVVVGDFLNLTGDEMFDGTLKQALNIALGQSPFIDLLAEGRVRYTLKLMGHSADEPLTPALGREVCLRTGSAALLNGRIAPLGGHYLVAVTAVACGSGNAIVELQTEVARQEEVLTALSRTASQLRARLGESLQSIQKFDAPIETTTASLEALRNMTLAARVSAAQGDGASLPFLKRAIELDPQFSLAYTALAGHYSNLGQPTRALEYASKAYELRERNTERDRLLITALFLRVKGELEQLTRVLEAWQAQYPSDSRPVGMLGANYVMIGQYDKALAQWQRARKLRPDIVSMYENLGFVYLALGRTQDARDVVAAAAANHLSGGGLNLLSYNIAFRMNDADEMKRQAQRAIGAPGTEDILYSAEADTEAYFGRLGNAHELTRQAVDSALRSDDKEAAGLWQASAALREAEFGESKAASADALAALKIDAGRNVKAFAALALARAGEIGKATELLKALEQDEPDNTVLSWGRLPSIRAAIALARGRPVLALTELEVVRPYELGQPTPMGHAPLYPPYLRGEAYLALHQPAAAAAEFNKVLEHPGIAFNSPLGPLAHLRVARAYAEAGDAARAQTARRELLDLWRNADAQVPTLMPVSLQ